MTNTTTVSQTTDNPRGWQELWGPMRAEALARSKDRRARVLAHPDLAGTLTKPPLDYARADQWTGYVPPATWSGSMNDSPRRTALVMVCAEALKREGQGEPLP